MQTRVCNPTTRQLMATLDNDSLLTQYHYDAVGKVVQEFEEILAPASITAPAVRLAQASVYNYAQMKTPIWVDQSLFCDVDSTENITG